MSTIRKQDMVKQSEYVWEIPQSFREDMQVPARLYASEKLLNVVLKDNSLEQLVNTATLPGLVGYALAMPDIHQGYGFPIGGVVASRVSDGIISPGGVGYDINCLSGSTRVLHWHGYTRTLADMASTYREESVMVRDHTTATSVKSDIVFHFGQPPQNPVVEVATKQGDTVFATVDHPFWTKRGMKAIDDLSPGDQIAVMPFAGNPYEEPPSLSIIDQADIKAIIHDMGFPTGGNRISQIVAYLERREMLPLTPRSEVFPYLLKILGFIMGDGTLYFEGRNGKGIVWFYGERDDLEAIRKDIETIGITPSQVYTRQRDHRIETSYATYEFSREENAFRVTGTAFALLMALLGCPIGNKTRSSYRVPAWMFRLPQWQQRLFLAGIFGAELSSPRPHKNDGFNFQMPVLSMNKREGFEASGRAFLEDIATLLSGFGVESSKITNRLEQINQNGERSIRIRLALSSRPESLYALWSRIGYLYNAKKSHAGSTAAHYLQWKLRILTSRQTTARLAVDMATQGASISEVVSTFESSILSRGFIEHSVYRDPEREVRIGADFLDIARYLEDANSELEDGMIWATIESIIPVSNIDKVFDITVDHPDHNFIANGFVVSNCGVRVLASNIHKNEIRPHIERLNEALYHNCPSGVGRGGGLRLHPRDFEKVLHEGSNWAVEQGYATAEDRDRTEAQGRLPAANIEKVPDRAMDRGISQIGTLGAGNHFIEVDVVDEIYDEEAAGVMGLRKGYVVVQIHCGSRGFGHQICQDYLRDFQSVVKRYEIDLIDRQLMCVPFQSPEGQDYYQAMCAAANFAFVNRQVLAFYIRRSFEEVLSGRVEDYELRQVYDIAHNMAKVEKHKVEGKTVEVVVHRKGATRAFGPGFEELPEAYQPLGQPVLVPGSMGTASWILVGTSASMEQTFGSTCHGAGRVMSRKKAKSTIRGSELRQSLEKKGISVRAGSMPGLAEEAPEAYKDVDEVVRVVHGAGIARKVARIVPIAVVKG